MNSRPTNSTPQERGSRPGDVGLDATPVAILARAQATRALIQDFTPLPQSIEWQLGQGYFRVRGNKAFTSDTIPVPYAVNNDGNLSARAADVFFASLVAPEQAGTLEPDIFVLELGIGVGLFARFFLDAFRRLCERNDKDFYDRIIYVAGDYSEKMLLDACRHGIFSNHAGHYLLRVVDALHPENSLAYDPIFGGQADRPFRAVFLNYVLDCLPATVLKVEGDVHQLCVRTCLARGVNLKDYTAASIEELAHLAASQNHGDNRELMDVFGLMATEYDFFAVDIAQVPHGDFAVRFGRSAGYRSLLHNYGAIQSLERLLGLLHRDGHILINDYGNTHVHDGQGFQHQRFSQSTSIGLNFPLLKAFFADSGLCHWVEPPEGDDASIHARLLGHQVATETAACFHERFSKADRDRLQGPAQQARECVKTGRFEAALAGYQQALERQPPNWVLMNEVAQFLTFSLRSPAEGLEMARAALNLNPACSSELWNTLGDSFFYLERVAEAEQAYLRALQINAQDVRARFNLAYVHARTKQYALGLQRIAEALALDTNGTYREGLLQKQSELLAALTQHNQWEFQRMTDRISRHGEQFLSPQSKTDSLHADLTAKKPVPASSASEQLAVGHAASRQG